VFVSLPFDLPTGPLPEEADVVVLGAGLAGAATARFLAEGGIDVVVVDPEPARVDPLGHVELGAVEQPHRTVASLGSQADPLFQFARHGADLLEADGLLDRCGGLWVAMEEGEAKEIPRSVASLTVLGERAEAWNMDKVEGHLDGGHMGPGLFLPRDGRVDPVQVRRRWLDAAPSVRWVEGWGEPVQDADHDGVVVAVGDRRIRAEVLVIAAGHRSVALDPALEGRLMPVRDQWLRTAPVDRALPLGRAGHGWTAWQQDAQGRLWVSGARWASPHLEVGETDVSAGGEVVQRIHGRLEAFLRDRLQVSAAIEARGARVFTQSPDGLPLIGPLPGDRRTVVAVGFGPSPVAWSVAAARSIADGILEGGGAVPRCLESRRLVRWRRT
jgi:glycine/D-amino acid oxidase-like deaminating enzyme